MGMVERHAKCRALVRKYYSDVPTREAMLERTLAPLLRPTQALLDAGCGDTLALLREYGPKVRFAAGVDLELPRGEAAAFRLARSDLTALPFRDAVFDVVVSRSVIEHLEHPVSVFNELGRVLAPGGKLIFTTPNKYYYSSLIARLIPFSWKDFYMRTVFKEDESYDHFPVYYRANTRRDLSRIASQTPLRLASLQALRHFPYYFLFSPLLFRLGMLYDWGVTALRLDGLQSNWLVVMERR